MIGGSLLGRTDESGRIDAALAAADGPVAVCLVGEAGIGKSAIWSAAVARARKRGDQTILTARATETERGLGHVVLADLLAPVVEPLLLRLPRPQAQALAAALLLDAAGGDHGTPPDADPDAAIVVTAEPRTVGTAVHAVLLALSEARPVLLAIDDLPWTDPASVAALGFAIRRLFDSGARIAILATARNGAGEAGPPSIPGVEPASVTTIEVGPVSLGVLHRLVLDRTGIVPTRPQLVRLEAASAGNPLLAIEIGRALARVGRWPLPGEPLPVPADIGRLVADRIGQLGPSDRDLLFIAATTSDPTVEGLAVWSDLEAATVAASIGRAVDAGLLDPSSRATGDRSDRVSFAHPLYAAAAEAGLPAERQRAIHAVLAERSAGAEDRGRHAALAGDAPDAVAAQRIEDAAVSASRRGAPMLAGEWAAIAADRTPADDGADAARRRLLAARWLGDAGEVARARAFADRAIGELPPGDARAAGLELAAQMAGWVDGPSAVIPLASAALADARDPVLRARILLRLANEADHLGPVEALGYAEHAIAVLRDAEQPADPDLLACALLQAAALRFEAGLGDDAASVEEARRLLHRTADDDAAAAYLGERLRALQQLWVWDADHDRYAAALAGATLELERARAHGLDRPLPILEAEAALLAAWLGDLPLARRHAEDAAEAAALSDHPQARSAGLSAVAFVALLAGALDRATSLSREGMASLPQWGFLLERHRATLGGAALARGDAVEATAILGALLDEELARGRREGVQARFAGDLAEAAVAAGDLDRAAAVLDLLDESLRLTPRPWLRVMAPRARALLFAARGDLEAADAAARDALAAAADLEMPMELGRTALIAGRIARRRKERRRAGTLLGEAIAIFERVGARAWLAIAEAETARLGRHAVADPDALTETEDRVARLAASGHTNREVADAVFLTAKSVEGVLARVYAKLGIRSRAELGAWLASSDRESPVSVDD